MARIQRCLCFADADANRGTPATHRVCDCGASNPHPTFSAKCHLLPNAQAFDIIKDYSWLVAFSSGKVAPVYLWVNPIVATQYDALILTLVGLRSHLK